MILRLLAPMPAFAIAGACCSDVSPHVATQLVPPNYFNGFFSPVLDMNALQHFLAGTHALEASNTVGLQENLEIEESHSESRSESCTATFSHAKLLSATQE